MSLSNVFMFSGQGSQYPRMGKPLYDQGGVFARQMDWLDGMVRAHSGRSVLQALYGPQGSDEALDDIGLTHPAIFMVEVALAGHLIEAGLHPRFTLGASLGAYAAAAVSGCVRTEDALELVLHHADCVASHCPSGGMLAVLDDVDLAASTSFGSGLNIAARGFPGHCVLTGPEDSLQAAERALRGRGTPCQRLPVRHAFHSPSMDTAMPAFLDKARHIPASTARIGMACCSSREVLSALPPDYFWRVTREPIEFKATIERLEASGPFRYVDVGPSATLSTFIRYALHPASASTSAAVMTPYGHDLKHLASLLEAAA